MNAKEFKIYDTKWFPMANVIVADVSAGHEEVSRAHIATLRVFGKTNL